MASPAVSIIVNVHNGASTLEATLRSALAQSFQDWELVAWDDGSTDQSAAVIAGFSDPRIRYCHSTEHSHLGAARSRAMAAARGHWLAFLDQDDLWTPDKLARQMALVQADEHRPPAARAGLVYGRTLMFFENGHRRDFDRWHEHQLLPEGDIFEALFACSCFICMSSVLLRRDLVERAGALPGWVRVAPDYFLFLELARTHPARAVQEPVCLYRVHAGGMTSASMVAIQLEALRLLERWRGQLPDALYTRRSQVHHSVLAGLEMRRAGQWMAGCRRLLSQGSPSFLLSRPMARAGRALKRRLLPPFWVGALQRAGALPPVAPQGRAS